MHESFIVSIISKAEDIVEATPVDDETKALMREDVRAGGERLLRFFRTEQRRPEPKSLG
jgi:hypothetical protein